MPRPDAKEAKEDGPYHDEPQRRERQDSPSPRNLAPRHRDGLSGVLPPGTRAMRIVVTSSVRPRRGAAVDVLATPAGQSLDRASTATGGAGAVVVAYGALVLATDRETGTAGTLGVTLLVTEDQALDLAAAAQGVLTLALVPPEEARGPSTFDTR